MEENKKQKEENEALDLGDWSPDHFPTSPKSVFRKTSLLVVVIAALCFLLYQCSEHETGSRDSKSSEQEQNSIQNQAPGNPFGDEEDELEFSL
jgi:hypothetical protein